MCLIVCFCYSRRLSSARSEYELLVHTHTHTHTHTKSRSKLCRCRALSFWVFTVCYARSKANNKQQQCVDPPSLVYETVLLRTKKVKVGCCIVQLQCVRKILFLLCCLSCLADEKEIKYFVVGCRSRHDERFVVPLSLFVDWIFIWDQLSRQRQAHAAWHTNTV